VNNPIRNETSLVLVVAVIFSAVAIPVLSGFLEPSQPPAVAAVQIGDPRAGDAGGDGGDAGRDGGDAARDGGAPAGPSEPRSDTREPRPAGDVQAQRRRSAPRRADPAPPAQSAPSAPADDAAEDDGGESD
jgi:hypothetical protein